MEYDEEWKSGKKGKDYGNGNGKEFVGKWKGGLDAGAKEFRPRKVR